MQNHQWVKLALLTLFALAPCIGAPHQGQASKKEDPEGEVDKIAQMYPVGFSTGYPGLVKDKTIQLLDEAENMLSRVKVLKERRWLEAFLFKMKELVDTVKKSMVQENSESSGKEHEPSFIDNTESSSVEINNPQEPQTKRDQPKDPLSPSVGELAQEFHETVEVSSPANEFPEVKNNYRQTQGLKAAERPLEAQISYRSRGMPEAVETYNPKPSTEPQPSKRVNTTPYPTATEHANYDVVDQQQAVETTVIYEADSPTNTALSTAPSHKIVTGLRLKRQNYTESNSMDELERELGELHRLAALEHSSSDELKSKSAPEENSPKENDKTQKTNNNLKSPSFFSRFSKEFPAKVESSTASYAAPESDQKQSVQLITKAQTTKELPTKLTPAMPDSLEQDAMPVLLMPNAQAESLQITSAPDMNNNVEEAVSSTDTNEAAKKVYEDELVRELEELPRLVALERLQSSSTANPTDLSTLEKAHKADSFLSGYLEAKENEKRRNEGYLADEIPNLRNLGAATGEIGKVLTLNELQMPGMMQHSYWNLMGQRKEVGFPNVQDSSTGERKPLTLNSNAWRPFTDPNNPKQVLNGSLEGMHLNFNTIKNDSVTKELQNGYQTNHHYIPLHALPNNIHNMLQKLQRENYLLKTRLMEIAHPQTAVYRNIDKTRGINHPESNQPITFLPHVNYRPGIPLGDFNVQNSQSKVPPYPHLSIPNAEMRNLTVQKFNDRSTTSNRFPHSAINAEFSDEMKRQLRDGKVILLSDSVVRSNFEPEKDKNEADGVTTET